MNESSWISVKDRLPDRTMRFLISARGDVTEAVFIFGTKEWQACNSLQIVTAEHWMPLPEPPPKPDAFEEFWKKGEILGHRTGDRSEVRGFYGQEYCVEKRTAMMVWDAAVVAYTKQSVV